MLRETLLLLLAYPAALVLRKIRFDGISRYPRIRKMLIRLGVFPITSHYYEPAFDLAYLRKPLSEPRALPGIEWNETGQVELLKRLDFREELARIPAVSSDSLEYFYNNNNFGSGDAEFLYGMIRIFKPQRIIEIGSGHSTKLARRAILENVRDDAAYRCRHVCVEPYEMPWLESLGVEVIRQPVETLPVSFFQTLRANDLLFIDSSHMIRPQGDVVFEYLELLPVLAPGVIVHVHDIFSPRDYPASWLIDEVRLWNEQYLLEAFLTHNSDWKILLAANYLKHACYELLAERFPLLTPEKEPGSIYLVRIR